MNLVMVPPPFAIANGRVMGNGINAELYNQSPDVLVFADPPSSSVGYGKVQSLQSMDTFHYDPMEDHKTWYGIGSSNSFIMLPEDLIDSKIWVRAELNAWMEQNLKGVVLVQRVWPSWVVVFEFLDDYQTFISWWDHKHKEEQMFIPVPEEYKGKNYEFIRELKNWCDANLTDKFELTNYSDRVKCAIRDPQEAVMFRLRWSEPTNNQL